MAIAIPTDAGDRGSKSLPRPDDQLMRGFARGDIRAFDQLYAKYKQPLYNYLHRNCQHDQVDEIFQDVWLRVIASAARFQVHNKFRAWLFTLAHNCLVDHYRKSARQHQVEDDNHLLKHQVAAENRLMEDNVTTAESRSAILAAIESLPPEQREAFYLREDAGFSIQEIAEIQTVTQEAAKSRLRYAYQKLRLLLKDIPRNPA